MLFTNATGQERPAGLTCETCKDTDLVPAEMASHTECTFCAEGRI